MVQNYIFFFFPPKLRPGLVHKTHMSSCRVDKPSEIVDVGDKVWVKLIGKEVTLILASFCCVDEIRCNKVYCKNNKLQTSVHSGCVFLSLCQGYDALIFLPVADFCLPSRAALGTGFL